MKIDFEMLDLMEAAGTPAKAIIAMLKTQFEREEAKKVAKRPKDAARIGKKRKATKRDTVATLSDIERQAATLSDAPRARMFRECVPTLISMNLKESRARGLLGQWLKETHEDEQLITATVLRAKAVNAADPPSWILAALQQSTGKRNGQRTVSNAFDDLIARSEGGGGEDCGEPADDIRVVSPQGR